MFGSILRTRLNSRMPELLYDMGRARARAEIDLMMRRTQTGRELTLRIFALRVPFALLQYRALSCFIILIELDFLRSTFSRPVLVYAARFLAESVFLVQLSQTMNALPVVCGLSSFLDPRRRIIMKGTAETRSLCIQPGSCFVPTRRKRESRKKIRKFG